MDGGATEGQLGSAPASHDDPVDAASSDLLSAGKRVLARDFPRAGDPVGHPGLYAWFVDVEGAAQLARGLGLPVAAGLIYAGQAGAGRSTATLRSRIRGNHLGGSITGSTFRMTLASVLAAHLGLVDAGGRALEGDGEARLTSWMRDHLAVAVIPEPDRARVAELEHAVLARLDPPLNLQGMRPSSVRYALAALRRARPRPAPARETRP